MKHERSIEIDARSLDELIRVSRSLVSDGQALSRDLARYKEVSAELRARSDEIIRHARSAGNGT